VPDIHFQGPYRLCSPRDKTLFDDPVSQGAGINLWTVRSDSGFIVEYVGQTGESFAKRTKDHLIQIFGGNYRICDSECMKSGEAKVVWAGLWRRGTKGKMPEFARRHLELAPIIQAYVETLEAFVAPFTGDRRIRERIEGAIALEIRGKPPPVGALIPSDNRYDPRRKDELPLSVSIECDENVLGVPVTMEV
jgi:hypothetical protein